MGYVFPSPPSPSPSLFPFPLVLPAILSRNHESPPLSLPPLTPTPTGTTWAYINRHVTGVSEGHTAVIRLVGIGYRATVEDRPHAATFPGQKTLSMKLGYTHPVELAVPAGVEASTPNPTRILLEGVNREAVMSFAGKIREWRKPEPYKGKGVFINDESIKLKQKKIK